MLDVGFTVDLGGAFVGEISGVEYCGADWGKLRRRWRMMWNRIGNDGVGIASGECWFFGVSFWVGRFFDFV